jgi:aminopeptidase N
MAHPVRPESFVEINNFTATVYEKGAEVIRMIQTLIGRDLPRRHGRILPPPTARP